MGETQSKERVPPGDTVSSNSSLVIHDANFRTGSLFRFDRLCAEDDPVAVLCDFAKTYKVHGGFHDVGNTYSSAGEVPGVQSKFLRLADKNPDLARRVALCHSTDTQQTDVVLKYISPSCEVTHFFEFLSLKAYYDSVSTDLFLTILRLAPEVARLEDGNGSISLCNAVGVGGVPLPVIKAIVTADDQVRKVGMKSVLEHTNLDRSNTIFGIAASWATTWGLGKDFFDRIDIMRYILDEGGTKNMLCSRSGAQYYLLHNIVDILQELKEFEDSTPSQKHFDMTRELLLQAASKMHDAWTGVEAPSMLFAAVWAAQYVTGWREIKGGTSQDMRFDVHVNHDTVGSIVSALIEQDPEQLQRTDERGNTPLHVTAGLDCWLANRHKELYGTGWGHLLRCLLDVDGELLLKHNCAGRLPVHIALSNYMTWDYGIEELITSNPATLRIADPLTRLLPFMSAGEEKPNRSRMGCSDDEEVVLGRLETSYRLLREDPAVILLVWNEK